MTTTLNIGRIPDRWRRNEDGGTTIEVGNPDFSGVREITISFGSDGVGRLGETPIAGGISLDACAAGPSSAVEQLTAIANSALGSKISQADLSAAIALAVAGVNASGTPAVGEILTERGPEIALGQEHAGCIYVHFHHLEEDTDRIVLVRGRNSSAVARTSRMLSVEEFLAGEPDGDGDLRPEIRFTITNPTNEPVRMIAHKVIFGDAPGYPLRAAELSFEPCNLPPNESVELRTTAYLNASPDAIAGGTFSAVLAAGLLVREFVNIGEMDIPQDERSSTTMERQIQSKMLEGPLKVRVSRSRVDEDGTVRVECQVLAFNSSAERLMRVELKCELVDGDGAVVSDDVSTTEVDAEAVACIKGGTMWVKPATLRGTRLRMMLSVFRPVEWAEIPCTSDAVGTSSASDEDDDSGDDEDRDLDDEIVEDDTETEVGDDEEEGDEAESDDADEGGTSLDPLVLEVLAAADAEEFTEAFEEHQITEEMLADLTSADLESMGVGALGKRKRILQAITDRLADAPAEDPPRVASAKRRASATSPGSEDEPDWDSVIASARTRFEAHSSVIVAPDRGNKKVAGALSYAGQIAPGTRLLLIYDDTMFGSAKDGVLVTSQGIHWKNQFAETGFQAWASVRKASPKGKSVELDPGGKIQVNWGGAKCAEALASFINSSAAMASVGDGDRHPQRDELREALAEMADVEEDGFVVVEESSTGALIVQFCNGDDGPVMDIPLQGFEQYQRERAVTFLGHFEFLQTTVESSSVFVREFDSGDLDALTSIAVRSIQGIHGLPRQTVLRIVRGWD